MRGKNEGSIRLRSDGRWEGTVTVPGLGRKSFYGKTRDDVFRMIVEHQHAAQVGNLLASKSPALGDYLDTWLDKIARPRVRAQTFKGYEVNVRVHLKPAIGHLRLDLIKPAHVQEFIARKTAEGLSPKSVRYMHGILRNALNHAMRWEYIVRNPAALVDAPRDHHHEIQPFTRLEAQRFLQAIKGDRLEALYSVALTMGLRQGEALGLRWDDIDLEIGYLRIGRQLQRVNHKYEFVEPKTMRSKRQLVVPAPIVAALRKHKERQVREREQAGRRWHETGLAFCRADGYPLSGSVVTHHFQEMLVTAGLPKKRFHDLRHSCATLLLAQGVSPRVVMEVLGHSQISLTMNTYTHVLPELKHDAANRMAVLIDEMER